MKKPVKKKAKKEEAEEDIEEAVEENGGPKVVGKIDLDSMNQKTRPEKKSKVTA